MSTRTIESHLSPADRDALAQMIEAEKPSVGRVREWLAAHGLKVKTRTAYGVRARLWAGDRTPDARLYLKVDKILRPPDRDAYAALIGDPSTTVRVAHAWLLERGYSIGRRAVGRHLRRFHRTLAEANNSAQRAAALARIVRAEGAGLFTDAVLSRFEQVVMEKLFRMKLGQDHDPEELSELSKSVAVVVKGRDGFERMSAAFNRERRRIARIADRAARKKGATPKDVGERIREVLGA